MVKLITVIGHGVNLLPHFIEHYQKHVDEINIAIYETELYPNLNEEVIEIIKNDFPNEKRNKAFELGKRYDIKNNIKELLDKIQN